MTATDTITPRVRTRLRHGAFWTLAAVGVAAVAALSLAIGGGSADGGRTLQTDSPAPTGGQALERVLEQHGVNVHSVSTLDDAHTALKRHDDATLLLYDTQGFLPPDQVPDLVTAAGKTVLVQPDFRTLHRSAPGVLMAGPAEDDQAVARAECEVPAAHRARTATLSDTYRIDDQTDAEGCFAVDGDSYGLVAVQTGNAHVTVWGNAAAFTNDEITHAGNAALALGLLGGTENVVWYLPSAADAGGSLPSLGDLTPGWLVPTTVLLMLTAASAILWRGRRFGALVVEDLPVVVPARETVEGRARLYARADARLRALDTLRMGSLGRLARMLGLSRQTDADQIVTRAAAILSEPAADLRDLLIDAHPRTDSDLMAYSTLLTEVERRVRAATDETGRM